MLLLTVVVKIDLHKILTSTNPEVIDLS